jgi:polar amino acid transport system substrate-binding protein
MEVGVTRNTASGALVARFAPRARRVAFESDMMLIEAAAAGRLDLFSTQNAVLDAVNRQAGYKMFEEVRPAGDGCRHRHAPAERALRAWINAWVFEQLRSGRLNEIYRRHHGRDLPAELRPAARALRWGRLEAGLAALAFLALLLAVPGLARADLLGELRAGVLRVAIAGSVPPYNAYRPDGAAEGSDVDIARALARDLGVRLEIVRVINSERVAVLLARRADLVISALSITPERERLIAFSVPYATIGVLIAAPRSLQLSSLLDLKGRRVGVLAGSSNLEHLLQHVPAAKLLAYADHDLLVSAYLAGDFEIMSATESVVAEVNARQPRGPRRAVQAIRVRSGGGDAEGRKPCATGSTAGSWRACATRP